MGLADRDYMHSRDRGERPTGPPDPTGPSTLASILFWIVFSAACYAAVTYWQQRNPSLPAASQQQRQATTKPVAPMQPPSPPTAPRTDTRLAGNWDPHRVVPQPSQRIDSDTQITHVTKCVVNGVTTYSDVDCAPNAKVSTVRINPRQNVADSTPIEPPTYAPTQPMPQAPPQYGQAPNPHAMKSARCARIDERIKWIDAYTRQPLSAWEQDRMSLERKELRDEQFGMRC